MVRPGLRRRSSVERERHADLRHDRALVSDGWRRLASCGQLVHAGHPVALLEHPAAAEPAACRGAREALPGQHDVGDVQTAGHAAAVAAARVQGSSSIWTSSGRKSVNSRRSALLLQTDRRRARCCRGPGSARCGRRRRRRSWSAARRRDRAASSGRVPRRRGRRPRPASALSLPLARVRVDPGDDDGAHSARRGVETRRRCAPRHRRCRRRRGTSGAVASSAGDARSTAARELRPRRPPGSMGCWPRARPSRSTPSPSGG